MTWTNSAQPGEQVSLPPWLITGLNLSLRINASADDLVHEEQASVQNNVFKTTGNAGFPVFKILNLGDVNFSGNTCHVQTTYGCSGEIENTTRLVVANNVMQTNARLAIAIRKVNAGVILGNNGNVPIEVNLASQVEAGYNMPPVQII